MQYWKQNGDEGGSGAKPIEIDERFVRTSAKK